MKQLQGLTGWLLCLLLAACNINTPNEATPTVEVLITETATASASPTLTPGASPTLTPTPSLTQPVVMLTPVQIAVVATAVPESVPALPAPPPTDGPYVHVIRENETLGYILQLQPWGYPAFDPAIIQAVLAINPDMRSADLLPPPGTELLIPRRTPTPIPVGIELTQTVVAGMGMELVGDSIALPPGTTFGCHDVEEGDTIIGIADIYSTSLEVISALNQNLNWSGCNFTEFSGGPGCNPLISINQCINVPLPTPTPVPSRTPSGSETATATPTFAPASLVYPPEGAVAPPGIFPLQWVSAGILQAQQVYLVEVQDVTPGIIAEPWRQVTRGTSLLLPAELIPTDGQTHLFQWRVSVAQRDASGAYGYAGGTGVWRTFRWQSR
ncbi:MAG: LysM peptidoglycan-binding domain-containing protein [Anaerolineae bacterium]|nr:LysM peptidoglycan-binding domain-containing protein [Anaerolineae bacterium]